MTEVGSYSCEQVVAIEQESRHHLVIANQFVRAFAVEVAPHERTLCHHHPNDYLLYVASGAEIISAARGEEPKRLNYADGECELSAAGLIHVVENLSDRPFRNIVVELLAGVSGLKRGVAPHAADSQTSSRKGMVMQIFEDHRAAIFRIEMDPGAEVVISGSAVVATPYGNKLNSDAIGDIEIHSNSICDLAWVPPEGEAVLRGQTRAESAVVFQIGRTDESSRVRMFLPQRCSR